MNANEIYKKDKAIIIKMLNKPGVIIGNIYMFLGIAVNVVLEILGGIWGWNTDSTFVDGSVIFCFWAAMCGMILSVNGLIIEKSVEGSRTSVKGAPSLMPTLLCIPVRKESVYRYLFGKIMIVVVGLLAVLICGAVVCLIKNFSVNLLTFIVVLFLFFTLTMMMFSCYKPAFKTARTKKTINVLNIVSIIAMVAVMVGRSFYAVFFGGEYPLYTPVKAFELGAGGAVILIVLAIVYPAAMIIVYKKIMTHSKGGSWYE